eukprot:6204724-Pleurochrysis_carterae.AAC.1
MRTHAHCHMHQVAPLPPLPFALPFNLSSLRVHPPQALAGTYCGTAAYMSPERVQVPSTPLSIADANAPPADHSCVVLQGFRPRRADLIDMTMRS